MPVVIRQYAQMDKKDVSGSGVKDSGSSSSTLIRRKKKKVHRSRKGKKEYEILNILNSNIQGIARKKESLQYIMEELDCDICLLAETMTKTVKLNGYRCINPSKSIGQNVNIIIRNTVIDNGIIKLHEPNELVNLMCICIELMNSCNRLYTAHLKQQSACSILVHSLKRYRRNFEMHQSVMKVVLKSKIGVVNY